MRKTDKPKPNAKPFMGIYAPTPPKPPRPGGPGTPPRSERTVSRTPTGKRKPNPVVKVVPKKPLTKSTVKNPSAPKTTGSGTSVKVITKNETFMKKAKAASAKTGSLPLYKTVTDSMKKSGKNDYKTGAGKYSGKDQVVKNTPDRYGASFNELRARDAMMRAAAGGKSKSKGVTPPQKKTPPTPPKPKTKSRFSGRPGLRGSFGGGGGLFGTKNK